MARFQGAEEIPFVQADPGVMRRIRAHTDRLMMVELTFEKGAVGAAHQHEHDQQTYILEGRFAFTNDGETCQVGPGDVISFASGVTHSTVCLEKGRILDMFSPARKDFL